MRRFASKNRARSALAATPGEETGSVFGSHAAGLYQQALLTLGDEGLAAAVAPVNASDPVASQKNTVAVRVLKRGHERISKGAIEPGTFRDEFYKQGDELELPQTIARELEERDFVEVKR